MSLLTTPLDALHRELGARMVPFAGYDMPVQYPEGILKEHLHTRAAAGLFDVSHMGQVIVQGANATAALEAVLPTDLQALQVHHSVYSLLMNDAGGVRDDLIVTRWAEDTFFLVVNAGCKEADFAYLQSALPQCSVRWWDDRALLALQGPTARQVLTGLIPGVDALTFMSGREAELSGVPVYVTCSGYTGEDGFELSVPGAASTDIARLLLAQEGVKPVGLGARDSLRLEAGLCLYGHELSPVITPVAAALKWAISPSRRPGGAKAGGYPGAEVVAEQWAADQGRIRVGLRVSGKRPVRDGQAVLNGQGEVIGEVCSGGFGATVGGPIGMAYVERDYAALDTVLAVDVRGSAQEVVVAKMPFVPARYFRG